MTSFDTTRTHYGTSASRSGGLFAQLTAAFVSWNETRKTAQALSNLTDRELADIGLNRGDIMNVAQNDFIR